MSERHQSNDAEAIVIGGGHNGLICATYLAQAGLDTLVVEARDQVGGCASTVTDLGARFNICSCDHTMIRAMPIIDELGLDAHGLRYLEATPSYLNIFHDRSAPWALFSDAERTIEGLAATHPGQVDGYRRYLRDALPVAQTALEIARRPANAAQMLRGVASVGSPAGITRLLAWSRRSAAEVLADYFDDWHLVMPAIGMGPTVWGVPPDAPGTGLAALGYATRHVVRTGRPVGGSGALPQATAAAFVAAGGRVRTGARVDRLLVVDGAVRGLELGSGERIMAPVVVAACDPRTVLVDWLDEVPAAAKRLVDRWQSEPRRAGYESKLDLVVDAVPDFGDVSVLDTVFPDVDFDEPTIIVSPTPEELAGAHRLRPLGQVADRPSMLVNTPSVLDDTMRPGPGDHVLSIEVLFTPFDVAGGWLASKEPSRWIDIVDGLADNDVRGSIRRWRAMTPDRYESEFNMARGYAPSYGAPPLATFFGRHGEVSRHRTPVEGLYLSGAGTWPGAGIFGAAGRNAALRVLDDRGAGTLSGLRTRWAQAVRRVATSTSAA